MAPMHLASARPGVAVRLVVSAHWAWFASGLAIVFAVPFLFADLLEINRDLFYGLLRKLSEIDGTYLRSLGGVDLAGAV